MTQIYGEENKRQYSC